MRNPVLILATAIAGGALALGLWSWQQWAQNTSALTKQETAAATVLPEPRPLPRVTLFDHNGTTLNTADTRENWSLWFFGFTHCPDVCPNTLGLLSAVKRALKEQASPVKVDLTFVSVDPARDTADKLKTYVQYFDQDMIGLTGSRQAIDALTGGLYLPYSLDEADESGQYNVEHSGALVLVDPDSAARAYFTAPHSLKALVNDLSKLIDS